jgi:hypothetical protein
MRECGGALTARREAPLTPTLSLTTRRTDEVRGDADSPCACDDGRIKLQRFCSDTDRWSANVNSESFRLMDTPGQPRLGVPGATVSRAFSILTLSLWLWIEDGARLFLGVSMTPGASRLRAPTSRLASFLRMADWMTVACVVHIWCVTLEMLEGRRGRPSRRATAASMTPILSRRTR